MKPVLGIGLIILVVLASGCIGQNEFFGHFGAFQKALERNNASIQNLLPPTIEQLGGLEIELIALQSTLSSQNLSQDQQAILLLIETELNLVHMQKNWLLGQEQTRFANLAFPTCQTQSNFGKALELFERAKTQNVLAQKNFAAFKNQYPNQSAQTGIDFDALQTLLSSTENSIQQSNRAVQDFCP